MGRPMTTIRTVIPYAPKENSRSEADIVDRTGSAIFEFVKHAGDETELQEARDVAHKLADELRATRDQLGAAHDEINALKADVRHYQGRANRAEKWLHQISSEIEQRSSLRADDGRSADRLGFSRTRG
jgi:peptidoglycan hydrolase CwlO-like protein